MSLTLESDVKGMNDFEKNIKQRSFIRKVMTGVNCRPGERLRVFVLTESNEAIDNGYDFILKFKHLVAFLRKKYGRFDYCCVLHRQGDKKRLNYHVLFYGSYIPKQVLEDWWFTYYGSHSSKLEEVKMPNRQVRYLSKYLSKQGSFDEFVAARFSNWWVFPGWWEFSKWIKREFLEYPPEIMIRDYHNKTETELRADAWYSFYLDSKVKTGKEVSKPRLKKVPFYKKVLRPSEYEILSVEKRQN